MYAADATFIGTSSAGFTQSHDDVRAYFVKVLVDRRPSRADVLEARIQTFDETAIVTALDRIEWSDQASPQISMGGLTFAIRRHENSWRIVAFHRSEVPTN